MSRKLCLAFCVAALVALPLACSSGSPSPTSPTTGAGIGSAGAFGPDNSTLKVTAPTPISPIDDVEIEAYAPDLKAANATGQFVSVSDLQYRFQLYDEDGDFLFDTLVDEGDGLTTATADVGLVAAGRYKWRVRAELGTYFGPWSTMAVFRTAPPPPVGGGPYGPIRDIGPSEMLGILIRVHNDLGFNLGSSSTREHRIAWLWTAVAVAHYGHPRFNAAGGDRNWCVKDAGAGRPPSDDVIVRCDSREAWDTVGGAGANGYTFHLDYIGRLPSEQRVYAPPLSSLPQ